MDRVTMEMGHACKNGEKHKLNILNNINFFKMKTVFKNTNLSWVKYLKYCFKIEKTNINFLSSKNNIYVN
jgi:hypothetical protein